MLLYDSKFTEFPGIFLMHWLGPYIVKEIMDGGVVYLMKMKGEIFLGRTNGSRLNFYMGNPTPMQ